MFIDRVTDLKDAVSFLCAFSLRGWLYKLVMSEWTHGETSLTMWTVGVKFSQRVSLKLVTKAIREKLWYDKCKCTKETKNHIMQDIQPCTTTTSTLKQVDLLGWARLGWAVVWCGFSAADLIVRVVLVSEGHISEIKHYIWHRNLNAERFKSRLKYFQY